MTSLPERITFGPIPSRRLGQSLGINNIPPKGCSYSCIYCQVGPTRHPEIQPRAFYPPEEIRRQVTAHLDALARRGEPVDYLSFVPDGEPTLDSHLGEAIDLLRPLGLPIAVISNASLTSRPAVRAALAKADWLSLKVDAVDPGIWHRVNRPHPGLNLEEILEGIATLARDFQGTLTTETMLVAGVNDGPASLGAVADFLAGIHPAVVHLLAPIRPPAEPTVRPPDARSLSLAHGVMSAYLPRVECLFGYEGDAFASTGRIGEDILAIAAVHPLREEALRALLAKAGADWTLVDGLVGLGQLQLVDYEGHRYYRRPGPDAGGGRR
jgi:wyosine [tRNA(Phe)-imidazoG37] synthetase (radical SAM superfamily)